MFSSWKVGNKQINMISCRNSSKTTIVEGGLMVKSHKTFMLPCAPPISNKPLTGVLVYDKHHEHT